MKALHSTTLQFTQRTRNPSRFTLTNNQSRNPSLSKGHILASGSSPAGVVIHHAVPSSLRQLLGTICWACIHTWRPRNPTDQPALR